jgi:hypothetical protein
VARSPAAAAQFRPPEPVKSPKAANGHAAQAVRGPFPAGDPAPLLTAEDIPPASDTPPDLIYPAYLWTVTPQVAQLIMTRHNEAEEQHELLGWTRTGRNRPVRWPDADRYSRDMSNGAWQGRNGETVKIAYDWTVPDGQHRLDGCIKAATPIETYIVFGVRPEWQDTMDRGIPRKIQDTLHLRGEKYANNLASIGMWSWRWVRGARSKTGYGFPKPSEPELIAWIEADQRVRAATEWGVRAYDTWKRIRVSVWGMAWLICHGEDHLAAEVFLTQVMTGENLPGGSPALVLRDKLLTLREPMRSGGQLLPAPKLSEHQELYLVLKAWRMFLADEKATPRTLKLPDGGVNQKTFSRLVDGK